MQTTKVKNGSITLPKELRKAWKEADVFLRSSDDTIIIKKKREAPFWNTWKKLKKVQGNITKQDIENAVRWARKQ